MNMVMILPKIGEMVKYVMAKVVNCRRTLPHNSTGVTEDTCGKPQ
jgi:hypothetical protein